MYNSINKRLVDIDQSCGSFFKPCVYVVACGALGLGAQKMQVIFNTFQAQQCISAWQTPTCSAYTIGGLFSLAVMVAGILGVVKGMSLAASNRSQPPPPPAAFFRSQQNGGPARYAEDDLQGTHRRPLGNYDPVRWDSGSQSI